MLRRNIGYKLLALAIAVGIWIYANVGFSPNISKELAIHAEFVGVPPMGYRFGTPQISPGRATVSGPAERVARIDRLVAIVDVGDVESDHIGGEFTLVPQDKSGRHIQGVEVAPEKVHLRAELRRVQSSRTVFVSPDVAGQPPFPCRVGSIEVNPDSVAVTGLPDRLAALTELRTEPVRLANRSRTFSERVRIIAPVGLTPAEKSVLVTVRILQPPEPPLNVD